MLWDLADEVLKNHPFEKFGEIPDGELKKMIISVVLELNANEALTPAIIKKYNSKLHWNLYRRDLLNRSGIYGILWDEVGEILKKHPWEKAWEITDKIRRSFCDILLKLDYGQPMYSKLIEKSNINLYQFLFNNFDSIHNWIETLLGENVKEVFDIHPWGKKNIGIEVVKDRLIKVFKWMWQWESVWPSRISSADHGLADILYKEGLMNKLAISNILWENDYLLEEHKWRNRELWTDKRISNSFSSFFNFIEERKMPYWSPVMIYNHEPLLYGFLIRNFRFENRPDWLYILLNFIPEKQVNCFRFYKVNFTYLNRKSEAMHSSLEQLDQDNYYRGLFDEHSQSPEELLLEKEDVNSVQDVYSTNRDVLNFAISFLSDNEKIIIERFYNEEGELGEEMSVIIKKLIKISNWFPPSPLLIS